MPIETNIVPEVSIPNEAPYQEENDTSLTLDSLSSDLRLNLPLSNLAAELTDGTYDKYHQDYEPQTGYDPLEDQAIKEYDPNYFVQSRSPAQTQGIIEKVNRNADLLARSEGAGLTGMAMSIIGNPLYLGAAIASGGTSLPFIVGAEVGAEAVNEAMLHSQQPLRTKEQSAMNIAVVGAATLAVGALAKSMSKEQVKSQADAAKKIFVSEPIIDEARHASAMEVNATTIADQTMIGEKGLGKLTIGPGGRVLQAASKEARVLYQAIANNPFFTKGMEKGESWGPALENLQGKYKGMEALAADASRANYKAYKKRTGEKLTQDEFEEIVAEAIEYPGSTYPVEVTSTAKSYVNDVLEPIKQEAMDLDVLPRTKDWYIDKLSGDLPDITRVQYESEFTSAPTKLAKGAPGYMPWVYSPQKIMKHYDELRSILSEEFTAVSSRHPGYMEGIEKRMSDATPRYDRKIKAAEREVERLTAALEKTVVSSNESADKILSTLDVKTSGRASKIIGQILDSQGIKTKGQGRIEEIDAEISGLKDKKDLTKKSKLIELNKEKAAIRKEIKAINKTINSTEKKFRQVTNMSEKDYKAKERSLLSVGKARASGTSKELTRATNKYKNYVKAKAARIVKYEAEKVNELREISEFAVEDDLIAQSVQDTINNMLGGIPMDQAVKQANPAALKTRKLGFIDGHKLAKFRERRASVVIGRHARGMGKYLAERQKFGDETIAEKMVKIDDEYKNLIEDAAGEDAKTALRKEWSSVKRDILAMKSRIHGTFGMPDDPSSGWIKGVRAGRAWATSTMLGGVVLSSLNDLARPMMQYGFKPYLKGATAVVKALGKLPKHDLKRMGIASDLTLGQSNRARAFMGDGEEFNNAATSWVINQWAKWSGFNHWTNGMEFLSGAIGQDTMISWINKGDLGRAETIKLARSGIDSGMVGRIRKQLAEHGGEDAGLNYANSAAWTDIEASRTFEAALYGDVKHTIIQPGVGDLPLVMSGETGKTIMMYKSFLISAQNRMLINGMQAHDAAFMTGIIFSLTLGMVSSSAKTGLRGRDPLEAGPGTLFLEGMDRSGIGGMLSIPINLTRQAAGDNPSRYMQRNIEGVLGGPVVSMVGRGARIATDVTTGDVDEKTLTNVRRMTPLINSAHIADIIEQAAK